MKAIIKLDVPDWQIGKKVSVYFPDTMVLNSICTNKRQIVKDWLSTFNTNSATECFTAVQRLKAEVKK